MQGWLRHVTGEGGHAKPTLAKARILQMAEKGGLGLGGFPCFLGTRRGRDCVCGSLGAGCARPRLKRSVFQELDSAVRLFSEAPQRRAHARHGCSAHPLAPRPRGSGVLCSLFPSCSPIGRASPGPCLPLRPLSPWPLSPWPLSPWLCCHGAGREAGPVEERVSSSQEPKQLTLLSDF